MDMDSSIRITAKSGKVLMGKNASLEAARMRKARMIILANNTPATLKNDIETYAKMSSIPVVGFPRSSQDLGALCGRPHSCSVLTIIEPGDSDILDFVDQ